MAILDSPFTYDLAIDLLKVAGLFARAAVACAADDGDAVKGAVDQAIEQLKLALPLQFGG